MSRWDIFRWRTLAGGPPCRQGRQRFSHRAFLSPRPKRVTPFVLTCRFGQRRTLPTGELRHKRRRGNTGLCGRWRVALSVTAAASVGRWATSHRDVAAPKGGAK